MSDTVDNVMNTVEESEPADVVVTEEATEPVEEAPVAEEVAEPAPVVEEEPEPAVEEPEPVDEEPEPVASASTTEAAEPAPSAPAPSEPVSTQEVVQNVQGILSSTETNVTVDNSELEERVKFLEERLESLVQVFLNNNFTPIHKNICAKLNEI